MDANITTITTTPVQTVSKSQTEALKGAVRALAEARPEGMDKGQRCAQIAQELCAGFGVAKLADLPAQAFPKAMKELARMSVPQRVQGPVEARLREAKDRLDTTLAELLQAMRGIARFRHEAQASLLVPLKGALDVEGKGALEATAQEGIGALLSAPLLQMEHDLDRMHEWLCILATRLPAIGRALDERRDAPATLGAD